METVDDQPEMVNHHPVERVALAIGRGASYLVFAYLLIVEVILFLGFLLHLLGANPDSGFVQWCYRNLESAMRPFRGIFQPIELGTAGNEVPSVLETSVIFAMVVYAILAIVASAALNWFRDRVHRLDVKERQEKELAIHRRELQAMEDRMAIHRAEMTRAANPVAGFEPPSTPNS